MLCTKIQIYNDNSDVTMNCYISDVKVPKRDAMLVLPGGGYSNICADREGEPIALAFLARGFNTFVLNYTTAPISDPYQPLIDASMAIAYIRNNAQKLGINKDRIFVVGFSAGAHLAAMLGSMWNDTVLMKKTLLPYGINRPTGVLLCYPVISCELQNEERVFCALLGDYADDKVWRDRFSAEKAVNGESVPAFVVHTMTDEVVPVKNSLVFAEMMAKYNILCELHVYPEGPHGMSLANSDTNLGRDDLTDKAYARWVDDACVFINRIAVKPMKSI